MCLSTPFLKNFCGPSPPPYFVKVHLWGRGRPNKREWDRDAYYKSSLVPTQRPIPLYFDFLLHFILKLAKKFVFSAKIVKFSKKRPAVPTFCPTTLNYWRHNPRFGRYGGLSPLCPFLKCLSWPKSICGPFSAPKAPKTFYDWSIFEPKQIFFDILLRRRHHKKIFGFERALKTHKNPVLGVSISGPFSNFQKSICCPTLAPSSLN